tara:strand:- start:4267 stop:5499 length:1233 start_codon:yes stop_codon:yes gene_type:complete
MACNCKNTITSFLGGDVPNPTTFLNCGEADGSYNNPLETGKTQCVAEDNVLRILDEYYISGTVKNSGQIVFERTVTGETVNEYFWQNDGTFFKPIAYTDSRLSGQTLNTSGDIVAGGNIFTSRYIYHTGDLDTLIDFTTNKIVVQSGGLSFIEADKKSSAPHEVTINDGSNNIDFVVKGNGSNAGNPLLQCDASTGMVGINGVNPGYELDVNGTINSRGKLIVTGNTVMNGTLSATTSAMIGNGNGLVSANTFTAPQISIGKELGVITGTTIAGKYSGATIQNSGSDIAVTMTVGTFRPNMLVEVLTSVGAGDVTITLPALSTWYRGKYTFVFPHACNGGCSFKLAATGSEEFHGLSMCLDGNEVISAATLITFAAGRAIQGTKIEVIAMTDHMQMNIFTPTQVANVTPS